VCERRFELQRGGEVLEGEIALLQRQMRLGAVDIGIGKAVR